MMIKLNIHHQLREAALHVELQAQQGSITVIHGPSGAGKTTLLKIIAGLLKPDEGKIIFDNTQKHWDGAIPLLRGAEGCVLSRVEMTHPSSRTTQHTPSQEGIANLPDYGGIVWLDTQKNINLPPQQRLAGFVFQGYALFPNMTVRQQLEYATNDAAWINELLKLGGLTSAANHKPDHISGGQQQRLAILRAMANKPQLLLMDEPFSALDQKTKTGLVAGLKNMWERLNTTVIIVSHYPQELTGIATQQLYIET